MAPTLAATTAGAYHRTREATASVSLGPNAPRSYNTDKVGSASTAKSTVAGAAANHTARRLPLNVRPSAARSPAAALADMDGNNTVAAPAEMSSASGETTR